MKPPRLEARDVWFSYAGEDWALRGAALAVEPGEFLAIIGQNASGKSTLAKQFNGLLRPARGEILHDGHPVGGHSVGELARRVGYAFQNPDHQLFQSTVEQELSLGPRYLELSTAEIEERVEQALMAFELGPWRHRPVGALNFGLRRKLSVAAVTVMRPPIVILDEPTGGLHWGAAQDLMDRIAALHADGHSIVLITHDMQLVAEYATRIALMIEGRIEATGKPQELLVDDDLMGRARIRPPQIVELAQRLALMPNGLTVEAFCEALRAQESQPGG